jgi:hypothetical protein
MNQLFRKLEKLRSCDASEIKVRASQQLASLSERVGVSSLARLPSDRSFILELTVDGSPDDLSETLLANFRSEIPAAFFAGLSDPGRIQECLKEAFASQYRKSVIPRAERILNKRFDLLGHENLFFGDPIDWHLEPNSKKRAPLSHWSRVDYLNPHVAGDKKITWELNRHQHFLTLGRAYLFTGDERYARCFAEQLESWMETNPPKQGINWASSLEVSFRCIAWIWALAFFRNSESLRPQLYLRALKFIFVSARHLETYLSTYFSPNTHLTGEALGLFYIGTAFPRFKRANSWRRIGLEILLERLDKQVRADGVYFEQSTYYHRYTVDFYTHLSVLAERTGANVDGHVFEKLSSMFEFLAFVMRPDGTTPLFGDDDGGRLVPLDERDANDFRNTLSNGAALLNRGDLKHLAGDVSEETMWLLGPEAVEKFKKIHSHAPTGTSRGFKESGFYALRDSWAQDATFMLLDCGPHGVLNCGHAHSDALSFDLTVCGRPMIVDPGTATYTGSAEKRNRFRSGAAHNAITVDGRGSSFVGDGAFTWADTAKCQMKKWVATDRFDLFEGECRGFGKGHFEATHHRSVLFIKDALWAIRDRVSAREAEQIEARFHFAERVGLEIEGLPGGAAITARTDEGIGLQMISTGGKWSVEADSVSPRYGKEVQAKTALLTVDSKVQAEVLTLMVPLAALQDRITAFKFENGGFEIVRGEQREIVLSPGANMLSSFEGVFEWLWARFDSETGALEQLVVTECRELSFDGQVLLREQKPVQFATASIKAGRFVIETREGACHSIDVLTSDDSQFATCLG